MGEPTIKIRIKIDDAGSEETVKRLENSVKGMSSSTATAIGSAAGVIAGFVGGVIGGAVNEIFSQLSQIPNFIKNLAKEFSDTGSQIHDVSQTISVSAESISTIKYHADQSGSSLKQFGEGFSIFEKNLVDGSKKSGAAFRALGIDVKKGIENPEAAFSQFLKNFNALPDSARKTTIAMDLFGKSGDNLIPTFTSLGSNFDLAKAQAEALGIVFTKDMAEKADAVGDSMDHLGAIVSGVGNRFIAEFSDVLISGMAAAGDSVLAASGVIIEQLKDISSQSEVTATDTVTSFGKMVAQTIPALQYAWHGVSGYLSLVGAAFGYIVALIARGIQFILNDAVGHLNEMVLAANSFGANWQPIQLFTFGDNMNETVNKAFKDADDARAAQFKDYDNIEKAGVNYQNRLTDITKKRLELEEKNRRSQEEAAKRLNNLDSLGGGRGRSHADKAKNEFHLHKDAEDVFNRFTQLMSTQPAFLPKLEEIAKNLGTQPEWILNVLGFESRLRGDAKNPTSSATGLVQLMDNGKSKKDGIYEYGGQKMTRNQIAAMSETEQLKLIEDYFAPFAHRLVNQAAVYAAVAAGKIGTDDTVFFKKGSKAYAKNTIWDKNRDGRITQKELGERASEFGFGTAFKLPNQSKNEYVEASKDLERAKNQLADLVEEANKLQTVTGLAFQLNFAGETADEVAKATDDVKTYLKFIQQISNEKSGAETKLAEIQATSLDPKLDGDLAKFDVFVKKQIEGNATLGSSYEAIKPFVDGARKAIEDAAAAEKKSKFIEDLKNEAQQASESLSSMTTDFKNQIGSLNESDQTPFGDFFKQIGQMKELKLPEGFVGDATQLFTSGNQIDTQKFAAYVEQWLTFMSALGGFDPAKIKEVVEKVKGAATAFQGVVTGKNDQQYKSISDDLNQQLNDVQRNGREITVYERTLEDLDKHYKNLSQSERDNLLAKAAQIDAVKSAQESYSKLRDIVGESVNAFAERGWKGLFDSIKNRFKEFLLQMATEFLTSKIASLLGGKGFGGQNSQGNSGGGFGNLFKGIFGGSSSSGGGFNIGSLFGGGNQGNGIFSFANGGSGSAGTNLVPTSGLTVGAGTANLAEQISLRGGGMVNTANNNPLSGLLSGPGISSAIASGGVTAAIALAQYALTTKSPIKGLLTGGLIGLAAGFYNRSKERKKEEKQRTEFLNSALSQIGDFDKLIADVRALRIDPPSSALTTGQTLSKTIHDSYLTSANSLKDKKTRNIALSEISGIDTQIAQKMAALKAAVAGANEASEFKNKFVATFADGGSVSNFALMSGMNNLLKYQDFGNLTGRIPGAYDRRDDKIIRVSGDEVVLTPDHWMPIVPYLKKAKVPGFADGGAIGSVSQASFSENRSGAGSQIIIQELNIMLSNKVAISEQAAAEVVSVGMKTPDNQSVVVKAVRIHTQENGVSSDGLARDLKKAERN